MSTAKGTVILTGANGGLGSAIVKQLADSKFASFYAVYTVRDANRAPELVPDAAHDVVSLDLTDLDNVRQVAKDINARVSAGKIPPIRALILNAGFQDFGKQSWTKQGLDPKYQTIVTGAERFHAIAKGAWSPATEDAGFRGGYRRYGAAKLSLIMMQHELQARLDADLDPNLNKVCVVGVDPGPMATGMQRLAPWVIRVLFFKVVFPMMAYLAPGRAFLNPKSRAAGDVLGAAGLGLGLGSGESSAEGREGREGAALPKGGYFQNGVPMETSEESRDVAKRALVWRETVKLTGMKEGETVLKNWK
ncbi:short-chain dehydrogenase [Apiospora saccharicola]